MILVARQSSGAGKPDNPPEGVQTFEEPSAKHVEGPVSYSRLPPTGGDHNEVWLNCGIYESAVPTENAVHSLEHGAVWITYPSSASPADVDALRALVRSKYRGTDRHVILSPFPGQTQPVIATAWENQLNAQSPSDPRVGRFIDYFRARPGVAPEPGARCTGGAGSPIG